MPSTPAPTTEPAIHNNGLHTWKAGEVAPHYSGATGYRREFPTSPIPHGGDWIVVDPATGKECFRALTEDGAVRAALFDGLTADAVRFVGVAVQAQRVAA